MAAPLNDDDKMEDNTRWSGEKKNKDNHHRLSSTCEQIWWEARQTGKRGSDNDKNDNDDDRDEDEDEEDEDDDNNDKMIMIKVIVITNIRKKIKLKMFFAPFA